jgi:REP-associated tyrosine transposase
MPRRLRTSTGGLVYHVMNRGVGRMDVFEDDGDYAAFERVLAEALEREPGVRLLGYCLMPNHWHLVVWPEQKRGQTPF